MRWWKPPLNSAAEIWLVKKRLISAMKNGKWFYWAKLKKSVWAIKIVGMAGMEMFLNITFCGRMARTLSKPLRLPVSWKSLHHHFSPYTTSSQARHQSSPLLPWKASSQCVVLPATHNPFSTLTASILFNRNQILPLLSVCLSRAYKARPYPFRLLPNHHPLQ